MITLIVTLLIGIILLNQLFLSGAGPTKCPYLDNNGKPSENSTNWINVDNHAQGTMAATANSQYDVNALSAWNSTQAYAWVGIGLLALAVIILAAVTILGIVRGGLGGAGV